MEQLIDKILPPKYHTLALAIIALSPYITRAYHALVMGGGLRGVFSAIWLGTNLPKDVKKDVDSTKQDVQTLKDHSDPPFPKTDNSNVKPKDP